VDIALALDFNIVPDDYCDFLTGIMAGRIEKDHFHLYNGVVGCKAVMGALYKNDRKDVLFRIISHSGFPSYENWISMGANTLWQNWDGSQSRNHIMFGFVDEYLMKLFMGMENIGESAGFKDVTIAPYFPPGLTSAEVYTTIPAGFIRSEWKKKDALIHWDLTLPDKINVVVKIPRGYYLHPDGQQEFELKGGSKNSYILSKDK